MAPRKGDTVRAFVALDLDTISLRRVARVAERLRMGSGAPSATWTPLEKMHVTLKFAGELPRSAVAPLEQSLAPLVEGKDAPDGSPLRLDAFPSIPDATVVVVQLEDADGSLAKLAQKVEKVMLAYGVPREDRPYRPHVTLARLKRAYDARRWLRAELSAGVGDCRAAGADFVREYLGGPGLHVYPARTVRLSGAMNQWPGWFRRFAVGLHIGRRYSRRTSTPATSRIGPQSKAYQAMDRSTKRAGSVRTLGQTGPFALLRITLVVAIATGGLSCHRSPSTDAALVVRVGYFANLTHAQAVLGVASGDFSRAIAPATLKTQIFNAGPSLIEALFAGEIDVGYVGPGPTLSAQARSHGEGIRVIAGAAANGVVIVVRKDSGIASVKELAGKRIATPQLGNTQDISARHFLSKVLGQADLNQVSPIDNGQQASLFSRGELDAAWVPEPWGQLIVAQTGATILAEEKGSLAHQGIRAHRDSHNARVSHETSGRRRAPASRPPRLDTSLERGACRVCPAAWRRALYVAGQATRRVDHRPCAHACTVYRRPARGHAAHLCHLDPRARIRTPGRRPKPSGRFDDPG